MRVKTNQTKNEQEVTLEVTIQQDKHALKTSRNFVETTTGMGDKVSSALSNLEVVVDRCNIKQTLTTDFFKKNLFIQLFSIISINSVF